MSLRVVVSGSSGLVGRALVADLEAAGAQVVRLVRDRSTPAGAQRSIWDPVAGQLDHSVVTGVDAVVNLNGRSIAAGRWTARVKEELRSSRLASTRTLVEAIARSSSPPRVLVNASAIGIYGDRGDEILDESSPPGTGFLATLASDWEAVAQQAESTSTRVVRLRLGVVVGSGGAVAKMLPPFKLGLGGPIGSGRQWWSWIGIDDVVGAIRLAIASDAASGAVNLVSPAPIRCSGFAETLGHVLRRPAVLPLPAFAARAAMGEMADALLLSSARVHPGKLTQLGYSYRSPDLAGALQRVIA